MYCTCIYTAQTRIPDGAKGRARLPRMFGYARTCSMGLTRRACNMVMVSYSCAGYPDDDIMTAVKITRSRKLDLKKRRTGRNVFRCFVFGAAGCGKVCAGVAV